MQNIRSAVQKHLKGRLTTLGAAYVRFLYAAPFALLYLFSLKSATGPPWPEPNLTFLAYCIAGGIAQIMFRSEEHTSELQSLMRISYAVFCLKKKKNK